MIKITITLLILSNLAWSVVAFANEVELDKVSVIVDQGVILESEIQDMLSNVKASAATSGQTLPSERALRTQVIERLIMSSLQLQMADRMGIKISDSQLDQTIANMANRENISMDMLRRQVASEGISFDKYREEVRKEIISGEVRRANVRRRVYITPQEIANLVTLINEQGAQQEEYRLGHILIGLPPQPEDKDVSSALDRAEKVMQLLTSGSDFAKIAIASSSGTEALEGGDMGWMNINAMPSLFSQAVQGKSKDALVGPIRSGAGFHILKVLDLRGQQRVEIEEVNARHILIKPSVILSEDKAREMLADFRQQILEDPAVFAELAKTHSADPGSALRGGELGWSDPSVYVPEFKDTLAKLKQDQISLPFRTTHGWHILQLLDRRMGDATEKRKEDQAYKLLFNRKFAEETDNWLREMRDSAYIELLDERDLDAS
jgi:peptidyl-prolyl cis-trans isomerase SurA